MRAWGFMLARSDTGAGQPVALISNRMAVALANRDQLQGKGGRPELPPTTYKSSDDTIQHAHCWVRTGSVVFVAHDVGVGAAAAFYS